MSPYKDKDKQREAVKIAVAKRRKVLQGITPKDVIPNVIPDRNVQFYKEQNELLLAENRALRAELGKLKEVKPYPLGELRQVIKKIETSTPLKADPNLPPLYNRFIHKAGDKVRLPDGQVIVVPEMDLDGGLLGESAGGRLVSNEVFQPTFNPYLKEIRAKKPSRKR